MKKENDEITSLFRSRLEAAELPVSEALWNRIERDIPVVRQRHRTLFFQRLAGAASVLLVLAGASAAFLYFSSREEIVGALKEVTVAPIAQGTMKADNIFEELPPIQTASKPAKRPGTVLSEGGDEEESSFFSFSVSLSFSSSEIEDNGNNEGISYAGGFRQQSVAQDTTSEPAAAIPAEEEKQRTWAIKVYAAGAAPTARQSSQDLLMFTSKANNVSLNDNLEGTISRSDFYSDADYDNYRKIAALNTSSGGTTVRHKKPVSVGLGVQKKLTDRFALETGLVYTQLNSELTAGGDSYYRQNQKLHYLGIPVKAFYTLYDSKKIDIYASAGAMLEKCVAGNLKTDYYIDGEKVQSTKKSLKANPLLLSLSASLGLQYKFSERLAVYAEQGVACSFDDGSSVASVRKEKPFNLSLLCGVRMTY